MSAQPASKRFKDDLGARFKDYEANYDSRLPRDQIIMARLDGHRFSRWTKGFDKPYDLVMANAMKETGKAMLDEFSPISVFSFSDEITLVFPPLENERQCHPFAGRMQKLCSLTASRASLAFADCILKASENPELDANPDRRAFLRGKALQAAFDCRLFAVPTPEEALSVILWRVADADRNSKSALARAHFPHKEVDRLSANEMTEKLRTERGVIWAEMPRAYRTGFLLKKERYMRTDGVVRRRVWESDERLEDCPEHLARLMRRVMTDPVLAAKEKAEQGGEDAGPL